MKRNNYYNTIGTKEEFKTKIAEMESLTNQDQLASASIVAMAEKYGIEAIIAKAKQQELEAGQTQSMLFGIDISQGFKSREQMLGVGQKLNTIFERIPAKIRKEIFNDKVGNFIDKYTNGDLKTAIEMEKIGLMSKKQVQSIQTKIEEIKRIENESRLRDEFIAKLETQKNNLFEAYKKTGTININQTNNNSSTNNDTTN